MVDEAKENLTPPVLARALVRLVCARALRDVVLGDMEEGFRDLARRDMRTARSWYWREALMSAAPLLRGMLHRSTLASAVVLIALSGLAYLGASAWEIHVARSAARGFASAFEGAPIVAARLVFVVVQMIVVAAMAWLIAVVTFRAEQDLFGNALRRLSPLAVLVIAPPLVGSLFSSGYPFSFTLPWTAAMAIALYAGARMAKRATHF